MIHFELLTFSIKHISKLSSRSDLFLYSSPASSTHGNLWKTFPLGRYVYYLLNLYSCIGMPQVRIFWRPYTWDLLCIQ